ncbi:MAG: hypothetical protein ACRDTC_17755 [Pseudonocardiaceae bacterium]
MSPQLGRFLALRRVRRGGIVQFGHEAFVDRGLRVPAYIESNLATLLAEGHIHPGRAQEGTGYLRLRVTSAGEASYTDLADSYRRQLRASRPGTGRDQRGLLGDFHLG